MNEVRDSTVGFVGLGMMGDPMAENIAKSGRQVVVYDIASEKVERMVSRGAVAASGAADVARQAAVQICMVETTEQADLVICGPDGFVQTAQPGDLVILMSTIDWQAVKRINAALVARGIDFIDAPVAGMRLNGGAKAASLKCFVGGDSKALDRARPILETMTSEIIHWGEAGSGTAFKLLNSMVHQVNRIVAAEALALGAKAGLDPRKLFTNLGLGSANSGALQGLGPRVLERNFDGIRMGITLKDVELQMAFGKAVGMPMLMTAQAYHVYSIARTMGLGDDDGAAVIKVYERWTGVPVMPNERDTSDRDT